jgi:hypothetical protein
MSSHATLTAKNFARLIVSSAFLLFLCEARAQPALISVIPPNGAVNVPTNTSVVFTFNTSMDPGVSSATFYYYSTNSTVIVPVNSSWSAGNTVLTCTPVSGFPPNTNVMWSVVGLSSHNELITPSPTGRFTTASFGSNNSLSLTNPVYDSGVFSFTVLTSTGQNVVVEFETNLTATTWQQLLTTNSPGNQFSVSAPTGSNPSMFFRARTGP